MEKNSKSSINSSNSTNSMSGCSNSINIKGNFTDFLSKYEDIIEINSDVMSPSIVYTGTSKIDKVIIIII